MYPFTVGIVTQTKELWEELRPALEASSARVVFELSEIPDSWPAFLDRIERIRPDVVILEVTRLREPIEEVVNRIRSTSVQPAVFALHATAEPQAILSALRGGAAEYLSPPLSVPLQAAFQRLDQSRRQSGLSARAGGKMLGFLSVKGGCGATTLACHVAADLALVRNDKVLLADLDSQAGLVGFLMKAKTPYSVADAAANLQRLDPSYWHALVSSELPDLEVLPAPALPMIKEVPVEQVKQVIAFARGLYGSSVVDLGRGLTGTTLSLLESIDEIYLVTTCDVPALHQAKGMIHYLLSHGYAPSRLRLVVNQRPRHMELTFDEIGRMLGAPVYAILPDEPGELGEAYAEGRLLDADSALGQAITELASKIGGTENMKRKRTSFFSF